MSLRDTRPKCTMLLLFLASCVCSAATIDFEGLPAGRIVGPNNPGGFTTLATFSEVTFTAVQGDPPSADNTGTTKYLVILDSNNPEPQLAAQGYAQTDSPNNPGNQSAGNHPNGYDGDPDLKSPWPGQGNLEGVNSGKLLVIAENTTDIWHNDKVGDLDSIAGEWYDSDDLVDVPDDWVPGGSNSGALRLTFNEEMRSFGFDLCDIEPASACCVEFFNGSFLQANRVGRVFFDAPYTTTPGIDTGFYTYSTANNSNNSNPFFDSSIVYGDSTANRLQPVTAEALATAFGGSGYFDRIQINFTTSIAFDSFTFEQVPEPGSLFLLAAGILALTVRRRRRR